MLRLDRHRILLGLGLVALAGLGLGLSSERATSREGQLLEQGRRLYWQQRRTVHEYEPWELLDQLAQRVEDPEAVLAALDAQPGQQVADLGCGSGYYSLALAERLGPEGVVWALDIQEESLAFLEERVAALPCDGCAPIRTVRSELDELMLPPDSVDALLMAHVDFHAYRPMLPESQRLLGSIVRALRPGGRLVVVQFMDAVPGGSAGNIQRNLEGASFELLQRDEGERVALLSFRKPRHHSAVGTPTTTGDP
jgi:ubiquinone/menaquinone biosynthesis C-methylase UbiE